MYADHRRAKDAIGLVSHCLPRRARSAETKISRHERDCLEHAAAARALRERLEAFHGRVDAAGASKPPGRISIDPDPVIRYAAQTAIEHQPLEAWRDRALSEPQTTASLIGLFALLRSGR